MSAKSKRTNSSLSTQLKSLERQLEHRFSSTGGTVSINQPTRGTRQQGNGKPRDSSTGAKPELGIPTETAVPQKFYRQKRFFLLIAGVIAVLLLVIAYIFRDWLRFPWVNPRDLLILLGS